MLLFVLQKEPLVKVKQEPSEKNGHGKPSSARVSPDTSLEKCRRWSTKSFTQRSQNISLGAFYPSAQ